MSVLALASSAALAADPTGVSVGPKGVILTEDGRYRIATSPSVSPSNTQRRQLEPGFVPIFDNFADAYPNGTYWCCFAAAIFGPQVLGVPEVWEAAAFTPSVDTSVVKIEVGAQVVSGTNGLVMTVNSDVGGVPGTELASVALKNLPAPGSVVVASGKFRVAVPVSGGQQYWVVLRTDRYTTDTSAGWNENDTDQVNAGPVAEWCYDRAGNSCGTGNGTWSSYTLAPAFAFAVYAPQ